MNNEQELEQVLIIKIQYEQDANEQYNLYKFNLSISFS